MNEAMKSVSIVRKIERPNTRQFIKAIFSDFMEFHGDRLFADDGAVVGGVAFLEKMPVTVIGIQKGQKMWNVILVHLTRKATVKHCA